MRRKTVEKKRPTASKGQLYSHGVAACGHTDGLARRDTSHRDDVAARPPLAPA